MRKTLKFILVPIAVAIVLQSMAAHGVTQSQTIQYNQTRTTQSWLSFHENLDSIDLPVFDAKPPSAYTSESIRQQVDKMNDYVQNFTSKVSTTGDFAELRRLENITASNGGWCHMFNRTEANTLEKVNDLLPVYGGVVKMYDRRANDIADIVNTMYNNGQLSADDARDLQADLNSIHLMLNDAKERMAYAQVLIDDFSFYNSICPIRDASPSATPSPPA